MDPKIEGPRDIARELGGWIEHSHSEQSVHVAIPIHVAEYLYGILLGVASRQVSSAVPSEEAAALGCRDSAVQRSGAVPGDTPVVHSTLLEMIVFAATGRCMACGWKLKPTAIAVEDAGCVQGNCSFRPGEHDPEYPRWWQRTQILTLARKYLSGELGKNSNLCDVQDATAGEG